MQLVHLTPGQEECLVEWLDMNGEGITSDPREKALAAAGLIEVSRMPGEFLMWGFCKEVALCPL